MRLTHSALIAFVFMMPLHLWTGALCAQMQTKEFYFAGRQTRALLLATPAQNVQQFAQERTVNPSHAGTGLKAVPVQPRFRQPPRQESPKDQVEIRRRRRDSTQPSGNTIPPNSLKIDTSSAFYDSTDARHETIKPKVLTGSLLIGLSDPRTADHSAYSGQITDRQDLRPFGGNPLSRIEDFASSMPAFPDAISINWGAIDRISFDKPVQGDEQSEQFFSTESSSRRHRSVLINLEPSEKRSGPIVKPVAPSDYSPVPRISQRLDDDPRPMPGRRAPRPRQEQSIPISTEPQSLPSLPDPNPQGTSGTEPIPRPENEPQRVEPLYERLFAGPTTGESHADGDVQPIFEELFAAECCGPNEAGGRFDPCTPLGRLFRIIHSQSSPYEGIGHERVPFALIKMPSARPSSNYRLRFDSVYNLRQPDRAELFWARPANLPGGKGPNAPERSIQYQDIVMVNEVGGDKFSLTTEIPIRVLNPKINANTTGLADMSIATKTVLVDGTHWLFTQYFRTQIQTGAFRKGLGTGNTLLEPGFLVGFRYNDNLRFHAKLTYAFVLGGFPAQQGQAMHYGLGVSYVLFNADTFAILPSFEYVGMDVLDGQRAVLTAAGTPVAIDIDGQGVQHFYPGIRFVFDAGSDLGVVDVALGAGIDLGSVGWYENMLRFEVRWSY